MAVRGLIALRLIAVEIAEKAGGGRYGASMQDDEWFSYAPTFRLCAIMIAGLEGDTGAMCSQRWQRFTPAERERLSSALRTLRRDAGKVRCCAL